MSNVSDVSLNTKIEADSNEAIRQKIRDENITDSTVLVLIATKGARGRKFIDWELAAAMYNGEKRKDGKMNDVCGIVVVDYVGNNIWTSSNAVKEKHDLHKGSSNWISISDNEIKERYSELPGRIVDSIINGASITIIPSLYVDWLLEAAVKDAHDNRGKNIGKYIYNKLRRNNS